MVVLMPSFFSFFVASLDFTASSFFCGSEDVCSPSPPHAPSKKHKLP